MMPAKKKLLGADGRVYCPHCKETVGKRTYWRHKRLFYNSSTDQWQSDGERISDSDEEPVHSFPTDGEQSFVELDDHAGDDSGNQVQSMSVSLHLLYLLANG